MALLQILRPTLPILIGASLMLTLSMGLRQSFGIFMQPLTQDIGISVSQFTLALAGTSWGFLQPLAGAMTVRYGFRPIMIVGSLMYIVGLALMATAQGMIPILIGAGVLIGASLACTANAIAMSVAARAVPATVRSTVMGMVSAAGSLGALVSAPLGQMLDEGFGWRVGVAGFVSSCRCSCCRQPGTRAGPTRFRYRPRLPTTSATLRRQQPQSSLSATHRSW